MNSHFQSQPARVLQAKTVVLGGLGLSLLSAVVLALALGLSRPQDGHLEAPDPPATQPAAARPRWAERATSIRQLQADARTLLAALHYLLEPETAQGTNLDRIILPTWKGTLAMPTNSGKIVPAV